MKRALMLFLAFFLTSVTAWAYAAEEVVRVRFSFEGGWAVFRMEDNASARDFVSMLPVTLTFSDYASAEKIGNLSRRLSVEGAPSGCDPSVGDLMYYAPWGNLAFFYRDQPYAGGLVMLGRLESGMDGLLGMEEGTAVTIERVD